ncbi:MAG: glycosyltransferase [Kouleothrix sp.]
MEDAFTRADVVSLPSIRTKSGKMEGIPVALMEPLAVKCRSFQPVFRIPELVEDGVTWLLVAPEDPVALANALQRLANDPELGIRLGQAGREKGAPRV